MKTWKTAELCELLGCKPNVIYRLVKEGLLIPLKRPAKPITVPDSEVQRLLTVRECKPVNAY